MASIAIIVIGLAILASVVGGGVAIVVRRIGELTGRSAPPLPLPPAAAQAATKLLDIQASDRVLDLGCGSGRFLQAVLVAQPTAQVIGLDHDPSVLLVARWRLRGHQAVLRRANLLATPWPPADKVFCYLYPELLIRLEPLLDGHLQPGTRLVTADYALPDRQPSQVVELTKKPGRGRVLYRYDF